MLEQKNYWSSIQNSYVDNEEDNGFCSISIDAWKTDDENEEGKVIAKVFGKWVAGSPVVFVDYRDNIARNDVMAQESIEEAKKSMLEMITQVGKESVDEWYDIYSDSDGNLGYVQAKIPTIEMYELLKEYKGIVTELRKKAEEADEDDEDEDILEVKDSHQPKDGNFRYAFEDEKYDVDNFLNWLRIVKKQELHIIERPSYGININD